VGLDVVAVMTPHNDRWLHAVFAFASVAIVLLVGVAVAREWHRPLTIEQRLVPALGVVDRCVTCHDEAKHPGQMLEQHPVERFGCTPCHGGQGLATSAQAAHARTPDWERPLFTPAERDAACGSCHVGSAAPIPRVAAGRKALAERGCSGCHTISGVAPPNHAPELDGLRDKLAPGWVRAWLTDPAQLDPRHKMPAFRLSKPEIEALVAYLWTLPGAPLLPMPADLAGDADRGKTTLARVRCATCHKFEGRGGDFAPDLSLAGVKILPQWLWNDLIDTHRIHPQTRMPGFKLSAQDAADIVAYAAEQWVPDTGVLPWQKFEGNVDATLAPKGQQLFVDHGCGGCHLIAGKRASPSAPALDRLGDRRLSDLSATTQGRVLPDVPAWVAQKVLEPRAFDVQGVAPAKMPTFPDVTPDEALALGIALATQHAVPPPELWVRHHESKPFQPPPGETGQLIARFRCLSCHRIAGEGGDVSRIPLDNVGARLRQPWLEHFLHEPVTVRMDQAERMPLLGMSEVEAQRLAAWLTTAFGDDRIAPAPVFLPEDVTQGKALYAQHKCAECHVGDGGGTMKGPTLDGAAQRLQAGYVVTLLRDPTVVPEYRHGILHFPDAVARALAAYVLALPVAPPTL
jgi:mono/diheme cytochrome c family protein